MISRPTVLILTRAGTELRWYLVSLIAEAWRARGIRVIVSCDLDTKIAADLCLLHVDLSVVPQDYVDVAQRYPETINLHLVDIRKTIYSRNLVVPGDGYEGPVIVKTVLNHAGLPEHRQEPPLATRIRESFHRRLTRVVPAFLPFQQPAIRAQHHYRVFSRRRRLPVGWIKRDDIVVERFMPERHGNSYVLREWFFLGDSEYYNCEISKHPVFSSGIHCPELVAPPPEAIRQVRRALRVDYGKIDYVIDRDGTPVLFDVNKTIGLQNANSPVARELASTLANGLRSCLNRPAAGCL